MRASWNGEAAAFDRVWSAVLEEMLILYYPPVEADSDEGMLEWSGVALKAYVADLAEFSRDVLEQGWQRVRRTHPRQSWPGIHALRQSCQEEAALAMPSRASAPSSTAREPKGAFARHDAAADACMRTDFGRKAIREGWGWELFCHVRDHGTVPSDSRVLARMKAAPDRAARAMEGVPLSHPQYGNLLGLHHAIVAKNDWLAEKYLGTVTGRAA